jgi:hypothetical protein
MTDGQFEQLINGFSLLAAQNQIKNHLAYLDGCGQTPGMSYSAPCYTYTLAEQFRDKIIRWDEAPDDFDLDRFFDTAFNRKPPAV